MTKTTKYEQLSSSGNESLSIATAVANPNTDNATRTTKSSWCRCVCKFIVILLLAIAILFAILTTAAIHGGYYLVERIVVPRITADHPLDLPTVTLPSSELRALKHRVHKFHDDLHDGKIPKEDLVLTQREINGLINDHHKHHHKHRHGNVYVTVTNNVISADFSFAAEDAPGGDGRYFVGTKTVMIVPDDSKMKSYNVMSSVVSRAIDGWDEDMAIINATAEVDAHDDGSLDVHVRSAEVMGWVATSAFVHRFFDDWNVMDDMCPHAKNTVKHIEGVEIVEGKVIIRVHKNGEKMIEEKKVVVVEEETSTLDVREVEQDVDGGDRKLLRN